MVAEQLKQNELPQAPRSFLAHLSVLRHEPMERVARLARAESPQYSTPRCLRITFSGSTQLFAGQKVRVLFFLNHPDRPASIDPIE
jgi:hypothetical protein